VPSREMDATAVIWEFFEGHAGPVTAAAPATPGRG
jgi:hypothetical protein